MKSPYILMTDTNADIPKEWIERYGIVMMTMPYVIGDTEYIHDIVGDTDLKSFYEAMRAGSIVTTVQRNAEEFKEFFRGYLEAGTDILYLGFSSTLSGTLHAAVMAKDALREEFPERKIIVIDSLTICASMSLLIRECAKLRDNGATIEEVEAYLIVNAPRACIVFCVEDLNILKRGGRLSSTAALFGSLLNVKPLIFIDNDGKVLPFEKVKGSKKALKRLVEVVAQEIEAPKCAFVIHADCKENADSVAESLREVSGIEEVLVGEIGPVIGAHAGPGTIGIAYFSKDRII